MYCFFFVKQKTAYEIGVRLVGSDGAVDAVVGGPTEEPSGIEFVQLGGLLVALAIAAATVVLFRRMPRS